MQRLTEMALERAEGGVFTRAEVDCWIGGTADRQQALLKRAVNAGEVLRLRRGLYSLAQRYLSAPPDPLALAARVYGPSYVSVESALSHHGLIPEVSVAVTSVSLRRSREFDTPMGLFTYTHVPQVTLYAGVQRLRAGHPGASCLMASPEKALADYVYVHKRSWRSTRPLVESLRIEPERLSELDTDVFERLVANYRSRRVQAFLGGLMKELGSCPSN